MTRRRSSLISLQDTPWYHVVSRCVRRAFLCGDDAHSGQNFDHRRQWMVDWILRLSAIFSIDVAAYAVMSNHYHIVLRVDAERAKAWSVEELLLRWTQLFTGPVLVQRYLSAERERMKPAEIQRVEQFAEEYRQRLMSVSWFMRILNQNIARQANKEDQAKGHFWESRFKSQALLDETALLSVMAYVDLNPIRAGIAFTPEESDFTSIQVRIEGVEETMQPEETVEEGIEPDVLAEAGISTVEDDGAQNVAGDFSDECEQDMAGDSSISLRCIEATGDDEQGLAGDSSDECGQDVAGDSSISLCCIEATLPLPKASLMPFDATGRFRQGIPFSFEDYLELVDTVGRTIRTDKKGYIPEATPKILIRLDIDTDTFIEHASRFLKEFGHAIGRPESMVAHAAKRQTKYLRGIKTARAMCCQRQAA